MRALSASELLSVWEWGLAQPLAQRGLALLMACCPEAPPEVLAKLSIGQRDAQLLTLREWTFGPHLVSLATCPECSERLELTFNVADIRAGTPIQPSPSRVEDRDGAEGEETLSLSVAGYEVRFRLPNSLDLMAIAGPQASSEGISAACSVLLERCLLAARRDGADVTIDQLPDEVMDAVEARMAEADSQADVQLDLACPACGHQWGAVFDILPFFWSEINAWAYRTLREVHILASAYGWLETDILAMSPWRRGFYLELVSGS